jgi:hypothetical protein
MHTHPPRVQAQVILLLNTSTSIEEDKAIDIYLRTYFGYGRDTFGSKDTAEILRKNRAANWHTSNSRQISFPILIAKLAFQLCFPAFCSELAVQLSFPNQLSTLISLPR